MSEKEMEKVSSRSAEESYVALSPEIQKSISELTKSSLISVAMVLLGAFALMGSVYYSVTRLKPLEAEIQGKRIVIANLKESAAKSRLQIAELNADITKLRGQLDDLKAESTELILFLGEVSGLQNLGLVDKSVDAKSWQVIVEQINALAPGRRKTAILHAILLAWKPLPFLLHGKTFDRGVNSPEFIIQVLEGAGVRVPRRNGESQSAALREATEEVSSPVPGDLMFYRGTSPTSTGVYVMLYLGTSSAGGHGICLGVMGVHYPLQIVSATSLETADNANPADVFIDYRRPHYAGESNPQESR
jgi:hypothetical protein